MNAPVPAGPSNPATGTPETSAAALDAAELYRRCDPDALGFETTAEVQPLEGWVGQNEALAALDFGVTLARDGYNLFVLGPPGSGRTSCVREMLRTRAAGESAPADRCYVHGFDDPRRPVLLSLPAGRGSGFARDMAGLLAGMRTAIPQALASEPATGRRSALVREHAQKAAGALQRYREEVAGDPHVAVVAEEGGFSVVPARGGEPLREEAWSELPSDLREEILGHQEQALEKLQAIQREIQRSQEDTQKAVRALRQEVIQAVVEPRIASLREDYEGLQEVLAYLDRVTADVLEHVERFMASDEAPPAPGEIPFAGEDFFRRYEVNVLVSHRPEGGAPVVVESHPTLRNLMGQVSGQVRFGVVVSDFTRITPGAAHRAGGGYLILNAADLLAQPFSWGALKRALTSGALHPGDPASEAGFSTAEVLEPQAMPSRLKVVLVGEPHLYYLLRAMDPEFPELFKVKVDFAPHMERTPETEGAYARFLARQCGDLSLPPLDAGAAARVVEEGSRWADDQQRLTTRFRDVRDLLVEAAHRRADGGAPIAAADVDAAVTARERRERRPQRELLDLIGRGVLAFEPAGEKVGQLHGIALTQLGQEPYGRPIRVIASAFLGAGGVVNIEREAKLSGPIHSKGFLVLLGYLGRHFAREHPLILSASLSFDQIYEEVEGDSASAAELFVLLSAIGGVPLRQGIGVTGAINQEGTLLPVGGVTHKVEGFYAACARRGLTGEQGVLLPRRNVQNLCLRREVRDAVEAGRFQVWAADRVEDGWPIVSGRPAGAQAGEGSFPEGSVHQAVEARLALWAQRWRSFAGTAGGS